MGGISQSWELGAYCTTCRQRNLLESVSLGSSVGLSLFQVSRQLVQEHVFKKLLLYIYLEKEKLPHRKSGRFFGKSWCLWVINFSDAFELFISQSLTNISVGWNASNPSPSLNKLLSKMDVLAWRKLLHSSWGLDRRRRKLWQEPALVFCFLFWCEPLSTTPPCSDRLATNKHKEPPPFNLLLLGVLLWQHKGSNVVSIAHQHLTLPGFVLCSGEFRTVQGCFNMRLFPHNWWG